MPHLVAQFAQSAGVFPAIPDHGWFLLSCFRPISGLFLRSVTAFIREFAREFPLRV
jgi:hypothetical protein